MADLDFLPRLSELDVSDAAEGGIDPLGLYPIAESLGVRLVPGVRERQSRPRFLTCMAVSFAVCDEIDDESGFVESTPAWQVFEWYCVEGFVRKSEAKEIVGVPGRDKAARAIEEGVPLSPKRYLKSPAIFGFHGVYRPLARDLGIERDGRLGEAGYELLRVWAKEQGLEGFIGATDGPGASLRRNLQSAVKEGLAQNATARTTAWAGWEFFSRYLGIYAVGDREAEVLAAMLKHDRKGYRGPVLNFLVSAGGRRILEGNGDERAFHEALRKECDSTLGSLLEAISAYETFSRLCQDAFDDCLLELTRRSSKTPPSSLAGLNGVKQASRRIPDLFPEVVQKLEPFGESIRFSDTFQSLAEKTSATEWVERLAEYHRANQKRKLPDGKNPWFERFDDGSLIIRPLYRRQEGGRHDDSYLHAYRTGALWSFAADLKLIK
jgi:hypothetical protein